MDVTELGISTEVSPVQPENASDPMDVTESGIVIEVSPVHPENALYPMDVTEFGILFASVLPSGHSINCFFDLS